MHLYQRPSMHAWLRVSVLQASMPMVVFAVGTFFGTEKFTLGVAGNMLVVGTGIAIASYGERSSTPGPGAQPARRACGLACTSRGLVVVGTKGT